MAFAHSQKVLFRHCDPAGIVFYPRYFEMMNDCIEAFFEQVLAFPFSEIHPGSAVPTAQIATRFRAPSRLGDELRLDFRLTRVGRTSLGTAIRATCGDSLRFETTSTLVLVDGAGRPTPWPGPVRDRMSGYLKEQSDET